MVSEREGKKRRKKVATKRQRGDEKVSDEKGSGEVEVVREKETHDGSEIEKSRKRWQDRERWREKSVGEE